MAAAAEAKAGREVRQQVVVAGGGSVGGSGGGWCHPHKTIPSRTFCISDFFHYLCIPFRKTQVTLPPSDSGQTDRFGSSVG